jgi:mannose/fructose-specific phosphotransferase system component IIA
MSNKLKGVVLTHAGLSEALVRTVHEITGDDDALIAISNVGLGRDRLCDIVAELTIDSPSVVFVDLPGGSCLQAVVAATRELTDAALVSGVNLPMLLDFVFNREVTAAEAAERAALVGTQAIKVIGP